MTCTNAAIADQALTGPSCSGAGTAVDSGCTPLTRGAYASVEAGFQSSGVDNCKPNVSNTPPQTTGPTRVCCAAQ